MSEPFFSDIERLCLQSPQVEVLNFNRSWVHIDRRPYHAENLDLWAEIHRSGPWYGQFFRKIKFRSSILEHFWFRNQTPDRIETIWNGSVPNLVRIFEMLRKFGPIQNRHFWFFIVFRNPGPSVQSRNKNSYHGPYQSVPTVRPSMI